MKKIVMLCFAALLASCGQSPTQTTAPTDNNLKDQVLNGTPSVLGGRPYQVALLKNNDQFCGGNIISDEWILTAAHCVKGQRASQISVRAGSLKYNSGGQVAKVASVKIHPQYRDVTQGYDMAVMKLATPLKFNENVSAIRLPTLDIANKVARVGDTLIISGWGMTRSGDTRSRSQVLREAPLPIFKSEDCSKHLRKTLTPGMICGGVNEQKQGGCHGDSGGPLAGAYNNKMYVFGVVSWGEPRTCTFGGVYARVTEYLDWIVKNSGVQPDAGNGDGAPPTDVYKGTVNANSSSFQPNGTKGFEHKGGMLKASLSSQASGDFDLYLQKKEGVRWVDVGSSTNEGHSENITYNAAEGLYRWEVYAYDGQGDYQIKLEK